MELTEEIKDKIKSLNRISSLQTIENIKTVEELEYLIPSLYAEADAILCAIQKLDGAISKTKI